MLMRRLLCSALVMLLSTVAAYAEEGMWMPRQLPAIADTLRSSGMESDPAALARFTEYPLAAVVGYHGCTASFVSPRGLLLTNHHCAHPTLQYQSTPENNLLERGFLAGSLAAELPGAPGFPVRITLEVTDVTERIVDSRIAKLSGRARMDAMELAERRLIDECERAGLHRCQVAGFHGGLEFHLIRQLEIRDIRLVYAPPGGVGYFGGETDNWMWPRHSGDYTFLRAYVGKDGRPADYSPNNVPYAPAQHLRLARHGITEGGFVMLAGYPRHTNRHRVAAEVEATFGWEYPQFVQASREQLDIIARETKDRPDAALAYASTVARAQNYSKNRAGMLKSYARSELLGRKQQLMQEPALASAVAGLDRPLAERDELARKNFLLSYATPRLVAAALTMYELALQRQTADWQRKSGYQERDWPALRSSIESLSRQYDEQVDKALVRHFLGRHLQLPVRRRNAAFLKALAIESGMSGTAIAERIDELYAGSRLRDPDERKAWLQRSPAEFRRSDDSFIAAAVALYADATRREQQDRAIAGRLQRSYAHYMRALIDHRAQRGEATYPDANGTLRVSFGKVQGRAGIDDGTVWAAFTTLRGIVAKHTGTGDFNAPAGQIDAIRTGRYGRYRDPTLDSVPVNFLATLDITGGNSGSPLLNSRAELVGLAFDGVVDGAIADWDFEPSRARTIAVDLRYILWQMERVDGAHGLLEEMGALVTRNG